MVNAVYEACALLSVGRLGGFPLFPPVWPPLKVSNVSLFFRAVDQFVRVVIAVAPVTSVVYAATGPGVRHVLGRVIVTLVASLLDPRRLERLRGIVHFFTPLLTVKRTRLYSRSQHDRLPVSLSSFLPRKDDVTVQIFTDGSNTVSDLVPRLRDALDALQGDSRRVQREVVRAIERERARALVQAVRDDCRATRARR